MAERYDLTVIGSGPGGYVGAIRAAQLGKRVAIVERDRLGGVCLNWGCIPTKALLRTAEIVSLLRRGDEFGFSFDNLRLDFSVAVKRSEQAARKLSKGVEYLMKKNKVTAFDGYGRLDGPPSGGKRKLKVEKDGKAVAELAAKHIILATGARARTPPGLEPDGKRIWTYMEAMVPDALPKSLLVVGSGAIGMEFASFYRDLGAEVTVVEALDRVLPVEDEDISAFAHKAFEKQGITIHVSAKVTDLKTTRNNVKATVDLGGKSRDITVERVILAVGIVGNVEDLGIENTGVKVEDSHVVIDQWCETGEPGVYAIGDLVGPPWLAHKASHEGVVCVERIVGLDDVHPLNAGDVPACTYCRPQVASIGLTEKAAKEKGIEVKIGRFPYAGNGKAIALGEPEGLVKTLFDAKTGALLGAHMIGAEVTELIHGFALARTLESTEAELMATIFPHPTLSETIHESVLDAYGRAIHF